MTNKYDYLIIGAGPFGSVCAHELTKSGKKCLVIDKRNHIGGNTYCEEINGIIVHKYGPHIFHTDDKSIWDYVNQFISFNNFINSPIANYCGKLYNLPFNMNTFYQLWGTITPEQAKEKIESEVYPYRHLDNPKNLEEQALKLVGTEIYEKLIKGYSEKQWGRDAKEIPAYIIRRLPLRFRFDNNYFSHPFQGIPIEGYNRLTERLLAETEVLLNTNYFEHRNHFDNISEKIIYTGKIDEFFNYRFGELEYRSLHFESEILNTKNFQGVACMNFTGTDKKYTRIIEHKHFAYGEQEDTVITKEYPVDYTKLNEPYYPINDQLNQQILNAYQEYSKDFPHVIFGGRLAEYKYYDMDKVIKSALERVDSELKK